MTQFQSSKQVLHASGAETVTATGVLILDSDSIRAASFWLNISAISGAAATITVSIETSEDEVNFVAINTLAAETTTGLKTPVVLNRAEHALGKKIRISWVISGTTPSVTFDFLMDVMD